MYFVVFLFVPVYVLAFGLCVMLGFVLVYASVLVSASGLYSSLGHGVVSKRRDVYVC